MALPGPSSLIISVVALPKVAGFSDDEQLLVQHFCPRAVNDRLIIGPAMFLLTPFAEIGSPMTLPERAILDNDKEPFIEHRGAGIAGNI